MKNAGLLLLLFLLPLTSLSKEVSVAVFDFEPWQMVRGDKTFGINIDFVDELGRRAGFTPVYFKCPLVRCLRLAENGQVDMVVDLFRNREREKYLIYLSPAMKRGGFQTFYYSVNAPVKLESYDDLTPLTIGQINSAKYFPQFDQDSGLKKVSYARQEQLFFALKKNRVDVFIGNETSVDYVLRKQSLSETFVKAKLKVPIIHHGFLVMSKKSRHLDILPDLERVLAELAEDDYLNFVLQNYR